MKEKPLTDKQLQVIELIVQGEQSILDICETVNVSRTAYYNWRRDNKLFNEKLEEAIDEKVKILRQNVRSNANKYIKWLEDIAKNSKNDNARVNALGKLSSLGELEPVYKQEVTIKNDESEQKNVLLDMLKEKSEDGE
jgi:predicted DNA-binding protein YlxM (UPF0122 family)